MSEKIGTQNNAFLRISRRLKPFFLKKVKILLSFLKIWKNVRSRFLQKCAHFWQILTNLSKFGQKWSFFVNVNPRKLAVWHHAFTFKLIVSTGGQTPLVTTFFPRVPEIPADPEEIALTYYSLTFNLNVFSGKKQRPIVSKIGHHFVCFCQKVAFFVHNTLGVYTEYGGISF